MGRRVTSAGRRCSPPHIGKACALVPLLWYALAPRSDAARPVGGAASARPLVRARRVAPKYPLYKQVRGITLTTRRGHRIGRTGCAAVATALQQREASAMLWSQLSCSDLVGALDALVGFHVWHMAQC